MNYISFDILQCKEGGIVEIGAILADEDGNTLSSFQRVCNPGELPTREETINFGLSSSAVIAADLLQDVLPEFWWWVAKQKVNYLVSWGDKLTILLTESNMEKLPTFTHINLQDVYSFFVGEEIEWPDQALKRMGMIPAPRTQWATIRAIEIIRVVTRMRGGGAVTLMEEPIMHRLPI